MPKERIDDSYIIYYVKILVNDHNSNKNNVTSTERNQALVKGCLDFHKVNADNGYQVTEQSKTWKQRNSYILQPGNIFGVEMSFWAAAIVQWYTGIEIVFFFFINIVFFKIEEINVILWCTGKAEDHAKYEENW